MTDIIGTVQTLLHPLRVALANKLLRGVVTGLDDSAGVQRAQVQGLHGDTTESLERFQGYGFSSVPLDGAEVLIGSLGLSRDHSVVLQVDDRRYRIKGLESGEVALYTDEGDSIVLARGRVVRVTTETFQVSAGGSVLTLDSAGLTVSGDRIELDADGGSKLELESGGDATLSGGAIALDSI